MYVCICKKVTEGQIRQAVIERGVRNLRTLRREVGGCDQCGKCAPDAKRIISDSIEEDFDFTHCSAASG